MKFAAEEKQDVLRGLGPAGQYGAKEDRVVAAVVRGGERAVELTQTRTSGGSSDTDVNAFAVMPHGTFPTAARTVTPVANLPRTARRALLPGGDWAGTADNPSTRLTPCPRPRAGPNRYVAG